MTSPATAASPAVTAPPDDGEMTLEAVLRSAQLAQRSGRLDQAEAIFLEVLRQVPEEPNTLNFFGVLRHQQGRHDEALARLERAVRGMPDEPGPWLNLANVLIERGYHDDAIKALNNVVALDPTAVLPHNNLGILHTRRGELELAEAALNRALELGPALSYVHYNLASLYFRQGRMKECAVANLKSIALDGNVRSGKARKLLSRALHMMGDTEQAIENLRAWSVEEPDNPEPAHYLAGLGAAQMPDRASDAYVRKVFDQFAESFEAQLEKLGYCAPPLVAAELERLRGHLPAQPVVLDAGCGTGLCGPLLRPLAARLEGADLSPGMLARAAPRGVYDVLTEAELTAFLRERPATYDAVVSADVLIYFGDLDPLFAALAGALRPGGVVVATVEALDDADERDVVLQVHGRYAHRRGYAEGMLERHGLQVVSFRREVLRSELAEPVEGWVFSALRPV